MGYRIKELREEKKMSQEDLAKKGWSLKDDYIRT